MDLAFPIVLVLILLLLATVALAAYSLAPWLPSRGRDLQRIAEFVNPEPGQSVIDLGSGDARVVTHLAKEFPDATVHGVELALPMYVWGYLRNVLAGNPANVQLRYGNVLHTDLSDIDIVYVFGTPQSLQKKLKEKFIQELKPTARIISYTFSMKGWDPVEVSKPNDKSFSIYEYRVPDTHRDS